MIVLKRLRIHAFKHARDIEIWFPRRGSVLIEGQNEAGKSTLFEAVYFGLYGSPLVGEDSRATLEDVIPHGGDSASIELTVVAGDTELDIRRGIGFGRSGRHVAQQARVIVRRRGAPREEIHGPRPVNARILRELHDLDADTLRNSCFMEQKALDRLEALSRGQREVAIGRLLGLDHLQQVARALESECAELRRQLETRRGELEVAVWRQQAEEASQRAHEWEIRAAVADIRALIDQRDAVTGAATGKSERIAALREQIRVTERRVRDAERVKALLEQVQALREPLAGALAERQRRDSLVEERARLERMEREEVYPLAERLTALDGLATALARLREADTELAALDQLGAATAKLKEAQVACELGRREVEEKEARCAQLERRDLLRQWIQFTERSALLETGDAQREQLVQALDDTQRAERRSERATRLNALTTFAFLFAALAGGAGASFWTPLWGVAGLALVVAVVLGARWARGRHAVKTRRAATLLARDRLTRFDTRAELSRDMPSSSGDLGSIARELERAGVPLPASLAGARQQLDDLEAPDEQALAQARDARDVARTLATQREERMRALDEQLAALRRQLGACYDHLQTVDDLRLAQEEAHATRTQLAASCESRAAAIEVSLDAGALAQERGAAAAHLRLLDEQLARGDTLAEDIVLATATIAEEVGVLCAHLTAAINDAHALDIEATPLVSPVDDLDQLELAWKALHATLATAYMRLDEGGERERLAALASQVEVLEQSAGETGLDRASAVQALREALSKQGVACTGEESLSELCTLWSPLAHPLADGANIEGQLLDSRNVTFHARETAARSARARGLEGVELDATVCRERVAQCERELRRHETAAQLAAETQARIFRRVLPETALHMRTLLPELTEGRYRDVELIADENAGGADLKIRVWDQMAGRFVAKNLFSGGARDQFSLALRMAFALATLPKEVGATPGFVFLDEPLSSFDGERSRALVEILTTGAIARQFAQVMLVAHSRSFDTGQFNYRLRMAGGRIVESTLPDEREAEQLWAAETAIVERAER